MLEHVKLAKDSIDSIIIFTLRASGLEFMSIKILLSNSWSALSIKVWPLLTVIPFNLFLIVLTSKTSKSTTFVTRLLKVRTATRLPACETPRVSIILSANCLTWSHSCSLIEPELSSTRAKSIGYLQTGAVCKIIKGILLFI